MTSALALALLAAAAPVKLAAPGLHGLEVPAEALAFYNEHLALELQRLGFDVVTAQHLEAVLGLERQKQLLGCGDASCMAEIASALGADGTLIGQVAAFGETLQLDVKVISNSQARVLATFSRRVARADVLDGLSDAATSLAAGLGAVAPPRIPLLAPISTGVAAAVALGTGVGLLLEARSRWVQLHDPTRPLSDAQAADVASAGGRNQALGWVAVGLGAALTAATVALELMRLRTPVSGAAVVTPGGAAAVLSVALP